MNAWLIYYKESAEYNKKYIECYIEEGRRLGIKVTLIFVEDLDFGVSKNKWFLMYQGKEIEKPDFAICRAIYPLLSRQLEFMGIPVYNNSFVSEICNDKAKTYQYLAKTGITMVDTGFYKNHDLDKVLSQISQEAVIKAVDGHGGSQVFLASPLNDNHLVIKEGLGASDFVVQPLVGSRHQDLRVYVIGKKIIAAVLRTAREGFKANFSLGGQVCLYELSKEDRKLVQTIIDRFEFGLVGIDFIIGDQGELIFNEIEDVVGSRMLYQCSDINIVNLYLTYILEQLNSKEM